MLGLYLLFGMEVLCLLFWVLVYVVDLYGLSLVIVFVSGVLIVLLWCWLMWLVLLIVFVVVIGVIWGLDLVVDGVEVVGVVVVLVFVLYLLLLGWDVWLCVGELVVGLVVLLFVELWGSMWLFVLWCGDVFNVDCEFFVFGVVNFVCGLL